MDDLISRSALLAAYDKAHQGPPGRARKLIEEAPAAVVRCRDCKYGAWTHIFQDIVCRKREDLCKSPDWFCADGERKGGVHE